MYTNLYSNLLARLNTVRGIGHTLVSHMTKWTHPDKSKRRECFWPIARLPRLVSERDSNSLDKQTQALMDMHLDSLPVASSVGDIAFITLHYLHPLFLPHLEV